RFDHRRADAVRARLRGRQLLAIGREIGDPALLVAAAQLFDQSPSPRPLVAVPPAGVPRPDAVPAPLAGPPPPSRQTPDRAMLLAEARALAEVRQGPLLEPTLTLIGRVEKMEVTARGASLGPQQTCEAIAPSMR